MGGVEFISHVKLELTQQEVELIQVYLPRELSVIGNEPPFFLGTSIDLLRKGIEIKQKNVYLSLGIEKKIIEDLIEIRRYLSQATHFQGSYQFEVPINLDDLHIPEGFVQFTYKSSTSAKQP